VPVVECTMFYVLIFSLAAVLLIVAGVTTMSRRRRSMRAEEAYGTSVDEHSTHAAHGTHPDSAGRRQPQGEARPVPTRPAQAPLTPLASSKSGRLIGSLDKGNGTVHSRCGRASARPVSMEVP